MNLNIIAAIRKDKKDSKGLVPLYVYVYKGSKLYTKKSIGQKVPLEFWNEDEKAVSKKCPNATLLNSLLEKEIHDLKKKILEATITKGGADVKQILNKGVIHDMSFYAFAEKQIKEKKYAEETKRSYLVVIEKMQVYRRNLKISEVNFQFLQGFESYLRDTLDNGINTIWGNMKVINTFISDALKSKYITEDPFEDYKRPRYKQTERAFLNAAELKKVEDFANDTTDPALKTVANYFLFMCYTGLRYSDAIRFRMAEHIVNGERIVIETQKTKKVTNLYINAKINKYMDYVENHRIYFTQTYYNRMLRRIAREAGLGKKVSSHTARHSFGTALASLGVEMKVAQGLLAHGSIRSTQVYYHLEAPILDAAMKKFG
ncbi:MAG: site-specific integrase [Ferruginibacter sp.]